MVEPDSQVRPVETCFSDGLLRRSRILWRFDWYPHLSRSMTSQAARLARIFTPEYARRVNAQIVHPAQATVVKPNELESALARPLSVARYEPDRPAEYLAATLSYGLIKGTTSAAGCQLVYPL